MSYHLHQQVMTFSGVSDFFVSTADVAICQKKEMDNKNKNKQKFQGQLLICCDFYKKYFNEKSSKLCIWMNKQGFQPSIFLNNKSNVDIVWGDSQHIPTSSTQSRNNTFCMCKIKKLRAERLKITPSD